MLALQAPLLQRRKVLLLTKEDDPKLARLKIHLATSKELRNTWTAALCLVLQIA
jgi:hypothetical protein